MFRVITFVASIVAFSVLILFSSQSSLAVTTYTVNSTADPGDGVCNAAECTLREAIDAANASPGLDAIDFDAAVFPPGTPATIEVSGSWLGVNEALTIDGSGAGIVLQPSQSALDNDEQAAKVGLFVTDNTPADPTDFTLIGENFTIRNFTDNGVFFCGGGDCYSGPISEVSISGMTLEDCGACIQVNGASSHIWIANNEITSGDPGSAVFIGGASMSGITIENNPSLTGGEFGISLAENTASISDVFISGNGQIGGPASEIGLILFAEPTTTINNFHMNSNDAIFGVAIAEAASLSDFSVSGNTQVFQQGAGAPAVSIHLDPAEVVSGVHVDYNVFVGGVQISPSDSANSATDVSVTGNGEVAYGNSAIDLEAHSLSGVVVEGNETINAGTAVHIGGSDVSGVSVSGNGNITGNGQGVVVDGDTISDIAVNNNDSVDGNDEGVVVGLPDAGSVSVSNASVDGNGQIRGGSTHGVVIWAASVSGASISGNGSLLSDSGEPVFVTGMTVDTVAVDNNGWINRGVLVAGDDMNVNNVSVSGNVSVNGIHFFANQVTNVAIDDNGDITSGINMSHPDPGANFDHISVSGNGSITDEFIGVSMDAPTVSNVSVDGNGPIFGNEAGVSVAGETVAGISVSGNAAITTGEYGVAVSIHGTNVSDVAVDDNGTIAGDNVGVEIAGHTNDGISVSGNASISGKQGVVVGLPDAVSLSNTNVTIDGNGEVTGSVYHGVAVWAGTMSGVSISGNGSISGPGQAVYMPGLDISNVAVENNGATNGDVDIGNVDPPGNISDISVSGNGTMVGSQVAAVHITANQATNIAVDDNGDVSGPEAGVTIDIFDLGAAASHVSVSGNGSVSGGDGGLHVGAATLSDVSVVGNGSVIGGNNGVIVGGETLSDITVDGNTYIEGTSGAGVFFPAAFLTGASVSGNTEIVGGAVGVGFQEGVDVSNVSVDNNSSITGNEYGVAIEGPGALAMISISGNGVISGGQVAVGLHGDSTSGIDVVGNGSLTGDRLGVEIGGSTNADVSIKFNHSISSSEEGAVSVSGETNTGIAINYNVSLSGGDGPGVRVEAESNSDVMVKGNGMISSDGSQGVSITGQANDDVTVSGNRVTASIGIFVLSEANTRLTVFANNVEADFVGIVLIGDNPSGPRNRVLANYVHASTPDAAFGILLAGANRNLVSLNLVFGFEGAIPDLGGGGIGVVQESSKNLIVANLVSSSPDLFWDQTGTGNHWIANVCNTSDPPGLCW